MKSDLIDVQLPGVFRSDGSLGGVIQNGESIVLSNSNYIANSSIVILDGGNLELGPNLVIEFADDCSIIVKNSGQLNMDGAELKAQIGNEWGGIILESSPNKNETFIKKSVISDSTYGILVKSSGDVTIQHSSFKDIVYRAIYIQTSSNDQSITLSNVTIDNSGGTSIYARPFHGMLKLSNSAITNASGYGVYIFDSSYTPNSHVVLEDNVITSLQSDDNAAIYMRNYFNATVRRNQVVCKARYEQCIYFHGINAIIEDNSFRGHADFTSYYPLAYIYSYSSSILFSLRQNNFTDWNTSSNAVYVRFGQYNANGFINLQDNLFQDITAGENFLISAWLVCQVFMFMMR